VVFVGDVEIDRSRLVERFGVRIALGPGRHHKRARTGESFEKAKLPFKLGSVNARLSASATQASHAPDDPDAVQGEDLDANRTPVETTLCQRRSVPQFFAIRGDPGCLFGDWCNT
jgi:hypothetical protein